jgi:putative protease
MSVRRNLDLSRLADPELLAPAGSLAMLRTALAFRRRRGLRGAAALQPAGTQQRLRSPRPSSAAAIGEAHAAGRKLYVVSNVLPHNRKLHSYLVDMTPVVALKPDALIMADPGLIDLVRETWPEMPVHLSVQANTVNFAAVRFWQKLGIARIILSRELSLDEVAEIRQQCPDIELEVFVHGALCVAYSGRCLLSGYFNHRDPNQGTCTNSCRWDYKLQAATEDAAGDIRAASLPAAGLTNGRWLLEEKERRGELMPIDEDEHGTYIMNSKDLRAVEHVRRLAEIGVDSLKIEGRTKSPYYVARTAQVYRRAIDDAVAGRPFDPGLLGELDGLANRGYTDGFYQRHHEHEMQNYLRGHSESGRSLYVGDILAWDAPRKLALIDVKNRFSVGDRLEIIHPSGNRQFALARMQNVDGGDIGVAPGNGHRVWIPLPAELPGAMLARFV